MRGEGLEITFGAMRSTRREALGHAVVLAGSGLASTSWGAPLIQKRAPRSVAQVLEGRPSVDGAGVQLTRIIGQPALRNLDPFILLDRLHSNDPAAYIKGFPDHPHRGFETVSIMLEGHMLHRDSQGNHGDIVGGGAQWMTAGRGIVHSEMPRQEGGWLSGFQLWVNLPAKEKLCPQYYQDLQPKQLAEARVGPGGTTVRLISGAFEGLHGPVRDRPTQPFLATVALEDDQPLQVDLPAGHAAFLFVASGELRVGDEPKTTDVAPGHLAVLGEGRAVRLQATKERVVALIAAGKPLIEPIVQSGPFVMNTEAEIRKAWDDYRKGVLDKT